MHIFYKLIPTWLICYLILFMASASYAVELDPVIAACQRSLSIATLDIPVDDFAKDNNLRTPVGSAYHADGKTIVIRGRLFDENCVPISSAVIRVWEYDSSGKMPAAFKPKPEKEEDDAKNQDSASKDDSKTPKDSNKSDSTDKKESPTIAIQDNATIPQSNLPAMGDETIVEGNLKKTQPSPKDDKEATTHANKGTDNEEEESAKEESSYVSPFTDDDISKDKYFVGSGTVSTNNLGHFHIIGIVPGTTENHEQAHLSVRIYHRDFAIFQTKMYFSDDQKLIPITVHDPIISPRTKVIARKNLQLSTENVTWYDVDIALSAPNLYRRY